MLERLARYPIRLIAAEISAFARYYDRLVQVAPLASDSGRLFAALDAPQKVRDEPEADAPAGDDGDRRTVYLVHGNVNHSLDVQGDLERLRARVSDSARVALVLYNPYLRWLYTLAHALGIIRGEMPRTFLTGTVLDSMARLAGFRIVRMRPACYLPFRLLGLGSLVNRLLPALPLVRWLGLGLVVVMRPIPHAAVTPRPSLSVVIPARNEAGNIEPALQRLPEIPEADVEVLFVEGHSTDETWAEIQRVAKEYGPRLRVVALQQTGKGKNDAVRLGFSRASGDLLTILDADLTMPPELLPRFYEAYVAGHGDFVNGNRLVYPMEREAMRFLNWLGNLFFAKLLGHVLDLPIGDSLCGTKLLRRSDYERIVRWRHDFGEFDPFGDYDLLFPAAVLGLDVVDLPIPYKARTYGETNIQRFRHGLVLLRMCVIGFLRIKLGRVR